MLSVIRSSSAVMSTAWLPPPDPPQIPTRAVSIFLSANIQSSIRMAAKVATASDRLRRRSSDLNCKVDSPQQHRAGQSSHSEFAHLSENGGQPNVHPGSASKEVFLWISLVYRSIHLHTNQA